MARQKTTTEVEQHIVTDEEAKGVPAIIETSNALAAADAVILDSFDAIKAIGRIEAASFMATVAEKIIAETALNLKQDKKYKGLPYQDGNGNWRHVATYDEFCEVKLGKSRRRVDELVSNYKMLGPELYEQSERLGFRQRDYNALKALPEDDRAIIAQAIEAENFDKALELMGEMAAKHMRDKEATAQKIDDLIQTMEAKDKVIKDKTTVIDVQAERIAKIENTQRAVTTEQKLIDARSNLQIAAADIKTDVMTRLRGTFRALYQQPGDHAAFAAAALVEISRELAILRGEFSLPSAVSEDTTPAWLKDDALDGIPTMPEWVKTGNLDGLPPVGTFLADAEE